MNPKKVKRVTKFIQANGEELDLNPFLESYKILERVFNDFRIDANWFFCDCDGDDDIVFVEPKEFQDLRNNYISKLEQLVSIQKESLHRIKKI